MTMMKLTKRWYALLSLVSIAQAQARTKARNADQSSAKASAVVGEVTEVVTYTWLTKENFDDFLRLNEMAFVDLDAPWCVWCQRLAPTWEEFAQKVKETNMPLGVGRVDCMAQAETCRDQKVMAFPTLRFYQNGKSIIPDYKMDRTVDALMGYAKRRLELAGKIGYNRLNDDVTPKISEEEAEFDDDASGVVSSPIVSEPREPEISGGPTMRDLCQSSSLPYGDSNHSSSRNGDEFFQYSEQKIRIAPTCNSANSNARGTYNSFLQPCEFKFHVIPKSRVGEGSNPFQLSTACSDRNIFEESHGPHHIEKDALLDYVRAWPDECVGDFTRCYSVAKDTEAKIFLPHFCLQKWDIPNSVTHISVNCRNDKLEAQLKKKLGSASIEQEQQHHREKIAIVLAIVAFSCCCCWTFSCLAYKFVIVPYLKAMKRSKSDPDLQSLTAAVDGATLSPTSVATS